MAVKEFVTGKWYRWVGPNEVDIDKRGWNFKGLMNGVLDGRPHECIKGDGLFALFDFAKAEGYPTFCWVGDEDDFEEVEAE